MQSIHNQFQIIGNDTIVRIDEMHSIYGAFQIKRNKTCPPFFGHWRGRPWQIPSQKASHKKAVEDATII